MSHEVTEIKLSNLGPIEKLTIPLPADGGVVVLTGGQGSGKSTALRAIAATAGGTKPDGVTLRDGATRGAVEWGGAKLSVTRSRSAHTGELEVETIEGRYDIGALVDPQIRDPERADAARIKQLIALTGAKADSEVYRELLGPDRYDALDVDERTDDPIELFSRVVRAIQAHARRLEKQSDETRIDTSGLVHDAQSDVSVEEARELARKADRQLTELQTLAAAYEQHAKQVEFAEERFDAMKASYDGPTLAEAIETSAGREIRVQRMQQELAEAQAEAAAAAQTLAATKRHFDQIAEFEAIMETSSPPTVSDDDLSRAKEAIERANQVLVNAIAAEENRHVVEKAAEANAKATKLAALADLYRTKAKEAESVLATILPTSDIRVVDGRLVVSTDRSANELYADLSHGERAILAIRTAAKFIPKGGVATISQEMWAGISDENRRLISDEAKKLGVVIITAEVNDDQLGVEVV